MTEQDFNAIRPKANWILTSEDLPPDCEDVFITVKIQDAGRDPEYMVDVGSYSRCWSYDENGVRTEKCGIWTVCIDWDEGQEVCEVIAWMPTPEPYRETRNMYAVISAKRTRNK